jgi:hypothetical protein
MMKTDLDASDNDVWVVDVEDIRDLEKNMPGYRQRFLFNDPVEAWSCSAKALRAGFRATAKKVAR